MIINVAGTSGSGKSYLMRNFIKWLEKHVSAPLDAEPCYIDGRKEPIGYNYRLPRSKTIHLVGAYENADTAGCDTIRDVVWAYEYIKEQHRAGKHVVYEGLFMMNMTRGPQLAAEIPGVKVIQFTDPLSVCIQSINARRKERGEGPLLKKDNTTGNFIRAENYCKAMSAAGATVVRTRREKALPVLIGLLGFDERLGV